MYSELPSQSHIVYVDEEAKMSAGILVVLLAMSSAVSLVAADVESEARAFLERFDQNASEKMYKYSLASWAYNTDISQENSDKVVRP